MLAISGILAGGGIIAFLEAPYLLRKKLIKEFYFFLVLLVTGVTISVLHVLRIPLPNPLDWITYITKPISDYIFGMLK